MTLPVDRIKSLVTALSSHVPPFDGLDYPSFTDQLKQHPVDWTAELETACLDVLLYRSFGNAFLVETSETRFIDSGLSNHSVPKSADRYAHTPRQVFARNLDDHDAFFPCPSPEDTPTPGLQWWRFRKTDIHLCYDCPPRLENTAYPALYLPSHGLADFGLMLPDLNIDPTSSIERYPDALTALVRFCDHLER